MNQNLRIFFIILTLSLFGLRGYAQTNQPTDIVDGWRAAKWGMSVGAILTAFNGEAQKTQEEEKWRDGVGLAEIPKLEIENRQFEAKFIFDKNTRLLKQVVLRPTQAVEFPDHLFVPLEQKLTEKYGKPDFSSDENSPSSVVSSRTKKRSWKKGQTRIELKLFEISDGDKFLTVTYDKIPARGDNNL